MNSSVRIIAEAGVNHNGNMDLAKELIFQAAQAGADYIKFQAFSPEHLVLPQADRAPYQAAASDAAISQYEMLQQYALTEAQLHELKTTAKSACIGFVCSVFDLPSLHILQNMKEGIVKIPSSEIDHIPLLMEVGRMQAEVWLSTGMATMSEIRTAIEVLLAAGLPAGNILLMQCHSEYPSLAEDSNLKVIQSLQQMGGLPVGYSDHTEGIHCAIAAVALGAVLIEKHFTLDKELPGPDHRASLNPVEFTQLVKAIREVEKAMGDGIKRPGARELVNKPFVRKGIYTRRSIQQGEIFQESDLICLRPLKGREAGQWPFVINTPAKKNYEAYEAICE